MLNNSYLRKLVLLLSLLLPTVAIASEVDIVNVVLTKYAGTWKADVTLKHADEGWKHYADGWRVVDSKGNELGMRTLYHPHVNEQPFTRSLTNFIIPAGIKTVYIEARDIKYGWSPKKLKINLSQPSGERYMIKTR
ncbi:MAG: hypothetical protein QM484_15045 [Woeseiaceae bacterium]